MMQQCQKDLPPGFNPLIDKFGSHWCSKFMERYGLGVRRATNKQKNHFERMHKIHNYHWWVQMQMANEAISSESESESESGEYLDTISDGSESETESSNEPSNSDDSSSSES